MAALQERITELNEDLQRRIEAEINHLKYFAEESEEKKRVAELEAERDLTQRILEAKNVQLDELAEEGRAHGQEKRALDELVEQLRVAAGQSTVEQAKFLERVHELEGQVTRLTEVRVELEREVAELGLVLGERDKKLTKLEAEWTARETELGEKLAEEARGKAQAEIRVASVQGQLDEVKSECKVQFDEFEVLLNEAKGLWIFSFFLFFIIFYF